MEVKMENNRQSFVNRNWPWVGLLLIVLTVAPQFLGDRLTAGPISFAYGVWVGLVIVFFGVFIYLASKGYSGRRQ
jgi:multidrug transporter EmrE-like cation transporter